MRLFSLLLVILPLLAHSKVYYLDSDGRLPEGKISAVEARVSLSTARMGKLSQWTLGWGTDSVSLIFDCRNVIEGISEPEVFVLAGGQQTVVKDLDCSGGWNSLAVEWDGKRARILAGADKLNAVMTVDGLKRPEGGNLTVYAPSGKLKISDLIAETDDNDLQLLMTDADLTTIPVVTYLDSTESLSGRIGGEYSLGLLPTDNGFDLIYLGGARVNASAWKPGMKKGTLTSRGFQNHYILTWTDATGRHLPGEHYATYDPAEGLLTLNFPALKTTLRLAR